MIAMEFMGYTFSFAKEQYRGNGRTAIAIFDPKTGEECTMLTVNMPEVHIEPDEFIVKTWSENEDISKAAFKTGIFIDTGKRVGYINAPVWKFKDPEIVNSLPHLP